MMDVLVWYPLANCIAPQYGLDPRLALAIIAVESGGNPDAMSTAGAVGLMQIMPQEAGEAFRDRPQIRWLAEPAVNIAVGCKILRDNLRYYGDLDRAVMAYFAGYGNVPKDGDVTHEGAQKYLSLVKRAYRRLFPLAKWPRVANEGGEDGKD